MCLIFTLCKTVKMLYWNSKIWVPVPFCRTVNDNRSLEHLNPNAISMVVLEQLQQIAHAMPGGCLLSDKLLDTKRTITEVTIRYSV